MDNEKKLRRKGTVRSMLTALALFVIGLGLLGWSGYALVIFTIVAGVYMILCGLLRIRDAVQIKRLSRHGSPVSVQAPVILAAVEILCGVICALSRFILPEHILQLSGVMLMLYGVAELINAIFLAAKRRTAETPRPEEPRPDYPIEQPVYPDYSEYPTYPDQPEEPGPGGN